MELKPVSDTRIWASAVNWISLLGLFERLFSDCRLPSQQVISRWEQYMSKVKPKQGKNVEVEAVAAHFPFHKYFSNAPQPVFKGRSYEEDMDIAEGCYRHIKKIFTQLEVRRSRGSDTEQQVQLLSSKSSFYFIYMQLYI